MTVIVFLGSLLGAMALGIPIAYSLLVSGVALMWQMNLFDAQILAQNVINGADSFPLLAVPFFMLAGEIMNVGGLSKRIVQLAMTLVGQVRGGLGYVTILAACIMAALSGSAVADTAALAALLLPMMVRAGHDKARSGGLIASAGIIAPVIPPSIGFVIFGVSANVSISKLFLAGIVPGLLMGVSIAITWWWVARRDGSAPPPKATAAERWKALRQSTWALGLPMIVPVLRSPPRWPKCRPSWPSCASERGVAPMVAGANDIAAASAGANTPQAPRKLLIGLIGAGIQHSLSPAMHEQEARQQGLRLHYQLIDVERSADGAAALPRLIDAARTMAFAGLNITYPCKQAVIPLLDALSDEAAAMGAVNTVVFDNGRATGHNTDGSGWAWGFRRTLPEADLSRVVLLGAGGAGSAIAHAVLRLGAQQLTLVDPDAARSVALADELNKRYGGARARGGLGAEAALADATGLIH
ncbi:MAG TPA: shikimate dehydrogenase, partial [Burkholderiaceae bacterium]